MRLTVVNVSINNVFELFLPSYFFLFDHEFQFFSLSYLLLNRLEMSLFHCFFPSDSSEFTCKSYFKSVKNSYSTPGKFLPNMQMRIKDLELERGVDIEDIGFKLSPW